MIPRWEVAVIWKTDVTGGRRATFHPDEFCVYKSSEVLCIDRMMASESDTTGFISIPWLWVPWSNIESVTFKEVK